jgi:hypothetical protein
MSKHFSKEVAEGFCAKIKDMSWGQSFWRGKDKKKSEVPKKVDN